MTLTEKLEQYTTTDTDKTAAELIQAEGMAVYSETTNLFCLE
jgi:hypothetical protein